MSLPTQRLFVSNKWYHQRVNHIKKLNLWHPIQNFGNFSFFQAFLGLWVYKVLLKLKKSYKSEFRHLFQWCILIPRKCQCKTPFQHTVPPSPISDLPTPLGRTAEENPNWETPISDVHHHQIINDHNQVAISNQIKNLG